MNKALVLFLLPFLVLCGCSGDRNTPSVEAIGGKAHVSQLSENLPMILLEGTSYEIGFYHGRLLKEMIEELVQTMDEIVLGDRSIKRLAGSFIARSNILEMKKHIPTEFMLEMEGISDGSGVAFDKILMLNVFDDLYNLSGCTNVAVWGSSTGSSELIHGRNLDYDFAKKLWDKGIVFLVKPVDGIAFVSLGFPGMVGVVSAMNAEGLSLGSMTSSRVNNTFDGVPTQILYRQIIQNASTISESHEILLSSERTIGNNLLIASAKDAKAVVFEIDSKEVLIRESMNVISAANHFSFLHNDSKSTGSVFRETRARELITRITDSESIVDTLEMAKILADRVTEREHMHTIANQSTIHSVIFLPSQKQIWFAANEVLPASFGMYYGFEFMDGNLTEIGYLPVDYYYLDNLSRTYYPEDYWTIERVFSTVEKYASQEKRGFGFYIQDMEIGAFLLKKGLYVEAISHIERVDTEARGKWTKARKLTLLVEAYLFAGNAERAEEFAREVLEMDDDLSYYKNRVREFLEKHSQIAN